jgi:hypothetical protein
MGKPGQVAPAKRERSLNQAGDLETPFGRIDQRHGARVQYRPFAGQDLSGRKPAGARRQRHPASGAESDPTSISRSKTSPNLRMTASRAGLQSPSVAPPRSLATLVMVTP